jgi:hypothetical protein
MYFFLFFVLVLDYLGLRMPFPSSLVLRCCTSCLCPWFCAFSITLKDFKKFADTAEALSSTTAVIEGKVNDTLEAFLKKSVVQKGIDERLAVQDKKLGQAIKDKFSSIEPVSDASALELFRCVSLSISLLALISF